MFFIDESKRKRRRNDLLNWFLSITERPQLEESGKKRVDSPEQVFRLEKKKADIYQKPKATGVKSRRNFKRSNCKEIWS